VLTKGLGGEAEGLLTGMEAQRASEVERWGPVGASGATLSSGGGGSRIRLRAEEEVPDEEDAFPGDGPYARLYIEQEAVWEAQLSASESQNGVLRQRIAAMSVSARDKQAGGGREPYSGYICHILWDVESLGPPSSRVHGGEFAEHVCGVVRSQCGLPLRHKIRFHALHSPLKAFPLPPGLSAELREAGVQLIDIGVDSTADDEAGAACLR